MFHILEIADKTGRKIRLTQTQFQHILRKHPMMVNYLEEVKQTLQKPDKIIESTLEEEARYYYRYFKHRASPSKFLLVVVKYLNGEGFIISTHWKRSIK